MTVIVIFQQLLFFAYFSRVNSGSSACRVCEASSTFMSFIKCYPKSHSKKETLINSQAPVLRTTVSVKKLPVSSEIPTISFSGINYSEKNQRYFLINSKKLIEIGFLFEKRIVRQRLFNK